MGISNFNVASNYCWSVSTHQIKRDSLLSLNILIDKDELLSLIILADIAREVLHVTPESFFMFCATIRAVRQKQVRPGKLFIIQRITSLCKPFPMHLFHLYLFKTVKSEINESKFK